MEILLTAQHWTNSSVKKEDSLNQTLLSMTGPRNVIAKQIVVLITFQSLQELSLSLSGHYQRSFVNRN